MDSDGAGFTRHRVKVRGDEKKQVLNLIDFISKRNGNLTELMEMRPIK